MPCDMSRYPPDWKERRSRILSRAGNRCEQCGVENGAIGWRDRDGSFRPECPSDFEEGRPMTWEQARSLGYIRIVLTIAHLIEEGPLDCPDTDLQALCQRCHNQLDAPMRARHRREKRIACSGALSLALD